jgi:hypothetical protein
VKFGTWEGRLGEPRRLSSVLIVALPLLAAGCNAESPIAPPPPPPPIVHTVNTPPTIKAITVGASRAEVGDVVAISAEIEDAETPVDQLKYTWTASAGTFTGTGRQVTWTLAKGAPTPVEVTFGVTVTETYADVDDANKPITRENKVSLNAPGTLRVHDSAAEIGKIVFAFLVTYFGNSNVSADAAVVDFIDPCPDCPSGKEDERDDVQDNRDRYTFISSSIDILSVDVNGSRTFASVDAYCAFTSTEKSSGISGTAVGICSLTALYSNGRWWLCESHARPLPSAGMAGNAQAADAWARRFFTRGGT